MSDLTVFLLARIAVDEDGLARTYSDMAEAMRNRGMPTVADWLTEQRSRVLAECEAKRRNVELHGGDVECPVCYVGTTDEDEWSEVIFERDPCPTLRSIAAVYADHRDYREEWRP